MPSYLSLSSLQKLTPNKILTSRTGAITILKQQRLAVFSIKPILYTRSFYSPRLLFGAGKYSEEEINNKINKDPNVKVEPIDMDSTQDPAIHISPLDLENEAEHHRTVIGLVKEEHHQVIELFKQYRNHHKNEEKLSLVKQIIKLMSMHNYCEEMVLYPAYRKILPSGDAIADASIEEHKELKLNLEELENMDFENSDFENRFKRAMELFQTHAITNEEQEILVILEHYATREQLIEFGEQYHQARESAPTRPHPKSPTGPILGRMAGAVQKPIDKVKDRMEGVE